MPSIRSARADDLPHLAEVETSAASVFRNVGLEWVADGATMDPAMLAAACRDGTIWIAADEADRPVGFLASHELDGRLHLAEVSVARSQQQRGIGAGLAAAAVDFARRAGFGAVTLTTYRDLSWNGPFYSRLGFVEIDPSRRCIMAMSIDK